MRGLLGTLLIFVSVSAFAAINDQVNCRVNLKRGIHTQAFQLNQTLTITRKPIPYALGKDRSVEVTEGQVPFEIFLGWDKISAKITYRFASLKDDLGRIIQASHWNCFEGLIETAEGTDTLDCGDKDQIVDPFGHPRGRWQSATILDERPSWPEGEILQGRMISSGDTLSVTCKTLKS